VPVGAEEYKDILEKGFTRAEVAFVGNQPPQVAQEIQDASNIVFSSRTQAYREVLLGCLLTQITDSTKDIRLPYIDLGSNAFSGRSLDERVINPFLHAKSVPCSHGPYLSVFRRKVKFDEATRAGLKDKQGYDAFLDLLGIIEKEDDRETLLAILDYILYRFVLLREHGVNP